MYTEEVNLVPNKKEKPSAAQRRAVAKYNAKAYDRIEMKVRKGEKAAIVAHAEKMGETLNKFLNRAVRQTVQSDGGELTVPPNSEENQSAE